MRTLSSLLGQPAPDTAKTTKLRAMGTQACIPQLLHTNETPENLRNALYALFIHCLRLSAGPSATRGVRWSDLLGAGPRSPGQITDENHAGVHLRGLRRPPHLLAPSRRVRCQLPPLRHIYPRTRPRAQWEGSGGRGSFLTAKLPASDREGASHHVTRARAYRTAARARRR